MGKVIKNFFYNGSYNLLMVLIPLILTPYLTRTLGSEMLGIDAYVISVVNIVKLCGLLGMNIYSNREIAYRRDDRKELSQAFAELWRIRIMLGVIVVAGYIVISTQVKYAEIFLIQGFAVSSAFIDITWLFSGNEDMKGPVMRNITIKIIQTILIFVCVKQPSDLGIYVWISAVSFFISSLCMYPYLRRYVDPVRGEKLNYKRHFKPILALFLPQAASMIYTQFDKTMIGWLAEDISYASIYDKAENLVRLPIYFVSAMSTAMLPRVANEYSKGHMKEIRGMLGKEMRYLFLGLLPMLVGMACIANVLVPAYLGEEYMGSILVLRVLSPVVFFVGLGEIVANQFMISVNETTGLTISYTAGAVCNVIANAILIPKFNAAGAAIGTIIAEGIALLIQYMYARKKIGSFGAIDALPKKLFAAFAMGAIILYMGTLAQTLWMMLVQIAAGAIIYFVILLALRDGELLEGMGMVKRRLKKS